MKTAFECFQRAAKCEGMALAPSDEANRTVLLETAKHWRMLGERAKATEAKKPSSPNLDLIAVCASRPKRRASGVLKGIEMARSR
jgi:hypothetical protein